MVSMASIVPLVFRVHVDRVRHETADRTQVCVAVRLQDDPEVGALAALYVDRPEKLALMAFWHFYNFPGMILPAALISLCFLKKR
jgi:hypothetical protein